ncbi:MAG: HD domain-containing protein [Oscillospiraceae bacterium]|nr:HD domain-containing protein [Oscillospiraceae bacterium]
MKEIQSVVPPRGAAEIMERLEKAGFEAYAVGGCVRDSLLGRTVSDWDITTSAEPEEIKKVFSGERIIESGIKHGTLTVRLEDRNYEVTTFRTDGEYSDSRRPDSVSFVKNLEEDLARRDFTVNAMAWSEKTGLVDLFGGVRDLGRGVIRCVGEPERRFKEDALRIMRAVRFASVLDFRLDFDTAQTAVFERERLKAISAERFSEELLKLLCGKAARRILLDYLDIPAVWIPELIPMRGFGQHHPCHMYDVLGHTAAVVEAIEPRADLRLAALLHDIGKPRCFTREDDGTGTGHFKFHAAKGAEIAEEICRRLKLSRAMTEKVRTIIFWHNYRGAISDKGIRRRLNELTPEDFFDILELAQADMHGKTELGRLEESTLEDTRARAKEIIARDECITKTQLAIDGSDLLALGLKPSRKVGQILDELFSDVLDDVLPNERAVLLEKAKKLIDEK